MKFYENYHNNNYDELLTYYPSFYHDVYEMNEILKTFGRLTDGLEAVIEQTYLNNFILTADLETVKIWEAILHITYKEKLSLDQRKRVIIGRISGGKHIGEKEIRSVISNYTDKAVSVDFAEGIIKIMIEGEVFDEDNLLTTLLQKIPAHIGIDMGVHINRTFRNKLHVCFGTGINTVINGVPNAVKRFSRSYQKSGGGMYCRTHITSKLIG